MVGLLLNYAFGTLCVCTVSVTGSDVMMLCFTNSQEIVILSASQRRSLPVVGTTVSTVHIYIYSLNLFLRKEPRSPRLVVTCVWGLFVDHAVGTFGARFQQNVFFLGCPS